MTSTRTDHLLSRVVDRCATLEDWAELDAQAAADPDLYGELIACLRDDAAVRGVVGCAVQAAASVAAPAPTPRRAVARPGRLVAALVLLAVGLRVWLPGGSAPAVPDPPQDLVSVAQPARERTDAGPAGPANAPEPPAPALAGPEGQVLKVLPSVVLSARPAAHGFGVEVVYLHRTVETKVFDALFEMHRDDAGVAGPVQVDAARLLASRPF